MNFIRLNIVVPQRVPIHHNCRHCEYHSYDHSIDRHFCLLFRKGLNKTLERTNGRVVQAPCKCNECVQAIQDTQRNQYHVVRVGGIE